MFDVCCLEGSQHLRCFILHPHRHLLQYPWAVSEPKTSRAVDRAFRYLSLKQDSNKYDGGNRVAARCSSVPLNNYYLLTGSTLAKFRNCSSRELLRSQLKKQRTTSSSHMFFSSHPSALVVKPSGHHLKLALKMETYAKAMFKPMRWGHTQWLTALQQTLSSGA